MSVEYYKKYKICTTKIRNVNYRRDCKWLRKKTKLEMPERLKAIYEGKKKAIGYQIAVNKAYSAK